MRGFGGGVARLAGVMRALERLLGGVRGERVGAGMRGGVTELGIVREMAHMIEMPDVIQVAKM